MTRSHVSNQMISMVDYSHITGLGRSVLTNICQPGDKSNFGYITGFQQPEVDSR